MLLIHDLQPTNSDSRMEWRIKQIIQTTVDGAQAENHTGLAILTTLMVAIEWLK